MYVMTWYDCQGRERHQNFFLWVGSYNESSLGVGAGVVGGVTAPEGTSYRASVLVLKGGEEATTLNSSLPLTAHRLGQGGDRMLRNRGNDGRASTNTSSRIVH